MIIDIINRSNIEDNDIQNCLQNFDEVLDIFCQDWKVEKPTLHYVPKIWPSFEEIKLTIFSSDVERGFHGTKKGIPYGSIYVKKEYSKILTHEIFEIIINPYMKLTFQYNGEIYNKEVCDPVSKNIVYKNNLKFSDWLLPSWFKLESKGPYNHLDTLKKPFEVDNGGYIQKND
jgi:hypothetical protein